MITPAQREAVARTLYDRDQEGGGNWGAFKSHWPEMLARYLADADEIIAAYEQSAWQPIETAPKDGTEIWLSARRGCLVGWWETGREFPGSDHFNDWCAAHLTADGHDAGYDLVTGVTHWRPLPAQPKESSDA